MEKFTTLTATAAPLDLINVDTDMIIPKQFLKTIRRTGLGVHLFDEMRYDQDGNEIPEFVLNQAPWRKAEILIAGDNFGCGSSREHAPWALRDFGIRCIIAPTYADIFYNNTSKNGILAIALDEAIVKDLMQQVTDGGHNARITVDLETCQIIDTQGNCIDFDIDPHRRHALLNGLDEIGLTLDKQESIHQYEQQQPEWLSPESA